MSPPGTPSALSPPSAKTAPALFSSCAPNGLRPSSAPFCRKSSGSPKPISRSVCEPFARITRHGASRATRASSASRGRSRKPLFSSRTAGGACPRAAFPRRTFSSHRRASSPATPRTSISAWSCQALGIPPTSKYQNEGGPGIPDIVELLRTYSGSAAEDVRTFLDSVAFNWLIVGTDAHAKNYALLIGAGGRVRLAPLYDLASVFPYPRIDIKRVKLSMKLGGEYRFRNIQIRHWRRQAEELGMNPDELVHRVDELAMQLTDHVPEVERRMTEEGLTHPLIHRLAGRLITRAAACRKLLRG